MTYNILFILYNDVSFYLQNSSHASGARSICLQLIYVKIPYTKVKNDEIDLCDLWLYDDVAHLDHGPRDDLRETR